MKTRVIQPAEPHPTDTGAPENAPGDRPERPQAGTGPRMGAGHIVGLVAAGLAALLGVITLAGGGVLLWANGAKTDVDGYYNAAAHRFSTDTHAIVVNGLDADTGDLDFLLNSGRLAEIRLTSTSDDPSTPVFVGIARQQDVADYLRDVQLEEVRDLDLDPFAVTYATLAGDALPVPPAEVSIWATTSTGAGPETLQWPTEDGSWSVVVMNADGSADVSAGIAIAARAPVVFQIGLGLAIGGGVLVLIAVAGLVFWIRSMPKPDSLSGAPTWK